MSDRRFHTLNTDASTAALSRRRLLKRGGALAGATALLGGSQLAASALTSGIAPGNGSHSDHNEGAQFAGWRDHQSTGAQTTLRLDVACDGNTLRLNRGPGVEPDAPVVRGDTFVVQGRIFPAGTIEAGLASPHQDGSIGQWVCRGWFYYDILEIAEGAVPHVVTTQFFMLDSFDGLVTEGMEGGIATVRAITGGYGMYMGSRGECREAELGGNDTTLNFGGGIAIPAFNIQFDFRLLM